MGVNTSTGNGQNVNAAGGATMAATGRRLDKTAKRNITKQHSGAPRGEAKLTDAEILMIFESALQKVSARLGQIKCHSIYADSHGTVRLGAVIIMPDAVTLCPVCDHLRLRTEMVNPEMCKSCERSTHD